MAHQPRSAACCFPVSDRMTKPSSPSWPASGSLAKKVATFLLISRLVGELSSRSDWPSCPVRAILRLNDRDGASRGLEPQGGGRFPRCCGGFSACGSEPVRSCCLRWATLRSGTGEERQLIFIHGDHI
ncbi:hypothetical protein AOLI_G00321900 [Acnodon oligacanthus]